MRRTVMWNVVMNFVLAAVAVAANTWALANNLEETFVAIALTYGIATVIANAVFLLGLLRNKLH